MIRFVTENINVSINNNYFNFIQVDYYTLILNNTF